VDRDVYRPRRFELFGARLILRYLLDHDPEGLVARTTARIVRRFARGDCAFIAVNGGWLAERGELSGRARSSGTETSGDDAPASVSKF
jgi:hypothetical protein